MLDLARALAQADCEPPVIRLNYTTESIARAHAEMLAEMAVEDAETEDE
jgi:hypothetical protein